ncbi:LysR family transcriptional regulator [Pokkaliibacter sp. MBI-7]|uniref:LysR family transcriptional regulator n=1 Tax=Pokkaliibacter sp. MBI-7 TaxID=3040600 RepID=UPI00244CA7D1|nr:LysR family transcriptional regulator [Pokkaliibacter sp. MBI-7]MDH2434635.1 LysR family transcriptional regulator [Pokkaliibacter sp. MBI-7]
MSIFVAVAEGGSLAAASRSLSLSIQTVMRSIHALEQRLDTVLLQRSPRGIALTPAGQQFARDCRQLLQDSEQAEASVQGLHHQPQGKVMLTAPLCFSRHALPALLSQFLSFYPQLELHCQFSDSPVNLHQDGIDVALHIGSLPDSTLYARPLGRLPMLLCASPAYLARAGIPTQPEELHRHRIIHDRIDHRLAEWPLRQSGQPVLLRLTPALYTTTTQSAIQAACHGGGIVRASRFELQRELEQGTLQTLLDASQPAAVPLSVLYREGPRAAARIRALVDFLQQQLSLHPALNSQNNYTE